MPARRSGATRSFSAARRPGALERRRVDVDEQRAQLADRLARLRAAARRARGLPPSSAPPSAFGGGGERERDAGEPLDGAVVEVRGDPAALEVRGVDRAAQQLLALALAGSQPARERVGERDLDEVEHQQGAEQRRQQADPLPLLLAAIELERW